MADLQLYLVNPHFAQDDDFSEAVERMDRCDAEAGEYFRRATADAKAIFNSKMADLAPHWNTPWYNRQRDAAKREFEKVSKPANDLRIRTCEELFMTGEVSEELSAEWDQFNVTNIMQMAAE